MAKKKRRWIPWTIGGIVVLLGLGYAVFAQTGIPHYYFAAPAIYAKAKALGVPMTAEELDPPREGENAGPEYVLLCQQVEETDLGPGADLKARYDEARRETNPENGELKGILIEQASLYGPMVDRMEKLSRLPVCQIERDYRDPVNTPFPELVRFKNLAQYQSNMALLDALAGRRERAAERLESVMRLSEQLRQGPSHIESLVATACRVIGLSGVRKCIVADPVGVRRYEATVLASPNREALMARNLRNEMYLMVASARRYDLNGLRRSAEMNTAQPANDQMDGLPRPILNRAMLAYALEMAIPVFEQMEQSGEIKDGAAFEQALEKVEDRLKESSGGLKTIVTLPAQIFLPVYAKAPDMIHREVAHERCLGVIADWVATGRRPTTLPLDPFSGEPIKVRQDGQTLIAYSVSRDRVDDGGLVGSTKDITVYYTPGRWWR